ncbi:MAG: ATP-binding protein [Nanoarchaeota archaeon]|nr:ATP-binding protein [Nanoarchaeota archaeon]
MKDLLKTIIKDFHERGLPEFIKRELDISLDTGKIISIIGPRRAGKTYMMYQLISKIADLTNVIYINFEDERLELGSKDLNLIIEAYLELYPDKKETELYFFFDEIQEIPDWEKFVRRVYDTISKRIFITGSSAKLLSREIATSLRGRTISYEIFPLSFKEYLRFADVEPDIHSTRGKAKTISALRGYMSRGGFPEIVNVQEEIAKKTLTNYFEVMLYRDIIERYNVSNALPLKLFVKRLLGNISKEFTVNKIFNNLKSEGIRISKDSLYNFLDYSEDSYILIPVNNFSESTGKQTIKKIYSIDVGLSLQFSFALSKDLGRILENVILLELKRRGKDVYYFKDKEECDFIIREKEKIVGAIQVCYELNEDNRKRELKGLKMAMDRFGLKRGLIITFNQKDRLGSIEVIPACQWLLTGPH